MTAAIVPVGIIGHSGGRSRNTQTSDNQPPSISTATMAPTRFGMMVNP